ncbi:MAG: cell division protein FtsL [Myxococcales bacterium]|nr:cell division protein FtsL [Myxococcales bacterium]
MKSPAASMVRILKRAGETAPPVGALIVMMILLAVGLTAVGVIRVARQHEVLTLGYQLSRDSEHVTRLREVRRQLELERATLTAPDRIRRLASELGMTQVAPDRIRIVDVRPRNKVAVQNAAGEAARLAPRRAGAP